MRQKCCGVYFSPIAFFPDHVIGALSKERVCEYFLFPIAHCLLPIGTACRAESAESIVEYIVYRFSSPLALFTGLGIGSFSNKVNLL